ncbi:MAG: tetratricopeptide repeat protein [Lewinellaceae bacterium]|nr:tetratricopeptide repeat protein [Lewinellaceae bacterium]
MSKRKKVKPVAKQPPPKPAPPPVYVPEEKAMWKPIFWAASALFLVLTLVLANGSGINGDDSYQDDYSEKLVNYYLTGGADTSALNIPKGNMQLYGGFFELVTGFTNRALGYSIEDPSYHNVRHLYNGLFGWLAMLFVGLFVRQVAGWRYGLLAFLFMWLSPRFLGHSLMNPKDIPFAMGYMMSLYFMLRWLKGMPKIRWGDLIGLAVGIGIALGLRAGGLLLFAYLGLFAGLDFLFKNGVKGLFSKSKLVGNYALIGLGVALIGFVFALLVWPYAMQSPIEHTREALSAFSKFGTRIRVLFQGENIMSDQTPWYYPIVWIVNTTPLYALVGIFGGLIAFPLLWRRFGPMPVIMAAFAGVFPIAYIIYSDAILYDGWRHLLFAYPGLAALAALLWVELDIRAQKAAKPYFRYALWGILALTMIEPALFIARNPGFPYVYFNPLEGGMKGAHGYFEEDYWGVSVRQAVERMDKEGLLKAKPDGSPVMIASSFSYNLEKALGPEYKGKVATAYVKYSQRYEKDWDYGIFPSRYIRGPHLRNGIWPPSSQIFSISANGSPLTAVLGAGEKHAHKGEQLSKAGDFAGAIGEFQQEVAQYPDNELAWIGLANAYLNTQQAQLALDAAEKALKVAPENLSALFLKGLALLNKGDQSGAVSTFQEAIRVDDTYSVAYYYLALIQAQTSDFTSALSNLEKALQSNPRFKQAYELAAQIMDQMGNPQRANELRQQAAKL